ncbi:MAG TPA: hypothetical protein VHY10_16975 [Xanthobacteraceae bacterium]|jgi:hypothetical protein|nr:hypothetical protein [Xanthobacteraceae bacterium]
MFASAPVFDDARTKIIGDAFDAVCGQLHGTAYPQGVREVIADRVIQIALRSSERDAARLADAVVASLGIKL